MKIDYFLTFCLFFLCAFASCGKVSQNKEESPSPTIEVGVAKLSGKIKDLRTKQEPQITLLKVYTNSPIARGIKPIDVQISRDRSFTCEIPTLISEERVTIDFGSINERCEFTLEPNKETKLEIVYKENNDLEVRIVGGLCSYFLSPKMEKHLFQLLVEAASTTPDKKNINTAMLEKFRVTPENYISWFQEKNLKPRLQIIEQDTLLNVEAKQDGVSTIELLMYYNNLLESSFAENMKDLHNNLVSVTRDSTAFIVPQEPAKSYFAFLKHLDLNNPEYLYNINYSNFCQSILSNKILALTKIGDTPIDEWLQGTKGTMDSLLGFNDGLFYDMLIANAYSMQYTNEKKPLSNKQIENIKTYFKGNEIEKMLFHFCK